MTAKFMREFEDSLEKTTNEESFLLISGTSAAPFMRKIAERAESFVEGLTAEVLAVENDFFGRTVNCTGLLTGGDIARAILSRGKYDAVVMPRYVLKEKEDIFLDDMTLDEFIGKIDTKVFITDGTGKDLFNVLSGKRKEDKRGYE